MHYCCSRCGGSVYLLRLCRKGDFPPLDSFAFAASPAVGLSLHTVDRLPGRWTGGIWTTRAKKRKKKNMSELLEPTTMNGKGLVHKSDGVPVANKERRYTHTQTRREKDNTTRLYHGKERRRRIAKKKRSRETEQKADQWRLRLTHERGSYRPTTEQENRSTAAYLRRDLFVSTPPTTLPISLPFSTQIYWYGHTAGTYPPSPLQCMPSL